MVGNAQSNPATSREGSSWVPTLWALVPLEEGEVVSQIDERSVQVAWQRHVAKSANPQVVIAMYHWLCWMLSTDHDLLDQP